MISPQKIAACQANWQKAMAVIKSRPLQRVQVICETCGGHFEVEPYRRLTAKCCSIACRQTRNARKNNGDKLRFTGDGKSYVKLNGRHMHRVIMEKKLGRPLQPGEIVHHGDINRRNNDPGNLILLDGQSEHINLHRP